MTTELLKNIASIIQSVITTISIIIGGIWVYYKFIRQRVNFPLIEFSADINFIGEQQDSWIIEIISNIENKGKVQHKIEDFNFDLNGLKHKDDLQRSKLFGGQLNFSHLIQEGSFIPQKAKYFFIDPGTKAKYSFVTNVPKRFSFIILHCWFRYGNRENEDHTAEKTVKVPECTEIISS